MHAALVVHSRAAGRTVAEASGLRVRATIAVVTAWARKKFKLDPVSASEFRLQICGTTDKPRDDVHLGELVEAPKCAICFDLVKEVTPQG